jgi:hypothetical protein
VVAYRQRQVEHNGVLSGLIYSKNNNPPKKARGLGLIAIPIWLPGYNGRSSDKPKEVYDPGAAAS